MLIYYSWIRKKHLAGTLYMHKTVTTLTQQCGAKTISFITVTGRSELCTISANVHVQRAQLISHASNKKLYKPYPTKSITKNKWSDLIPNLIPFVTGQEHSEVLHNWYSQQKPSICSKFFVFVLKQKKYSLLHAIQYVFLWSFTLKFRLTIILKFINHLTFF